MNFMCIPFRLEIKQAPQYAIFPLNVHFGASKIVDGKQTLWSALYEPDLSSYEKSDDGATATMYYPNRYNRDWFLEMVRKNIHGVESYTALKYSPDKKKPVFEVHGGSDWDSFFKQLTMIGLVSGETCKISPLQEASRTFLKEITGVHRQQEEDGQIANSATFSETMEEPASADQEWDKFTGDLSLCLAELSKDENLILSLKRPNYFVQFVPYEESEIRAEAVSNAYLEPAEALSAEAYETMGQLGWKAPVAVPNPGTAPSGSPNFFMDFSSPIDFRYLAELAVHTFRRVYRIHHPGQLQYNSFSCGGTDIYFAALHLNRDESPKTTKSFAEDEATDDTRWPQEICKAPKGKFRVIGEDTFPIPPEPYVVGDFKDLESAKVAAKELDSKEMRRGYIYDDSGVEIIY